MAWIRDVLLGVRKIRFNGTPLPDRSTLNFVGAAVTVTDNPSENRIDIEYPPLNDVSDATFEAIPNRIVKRGAWGQANFAGSCQFVNIISTGLVQVTGDVSTQSNLSAEGAFTVEGLATMSGGALCSALTVSGPTSLQGTTCTTLSAMSNVSIGGTTTATGAVTCNSDLTVAGTIFATTVTSQTASGTNSSTVNLRSGSVSSGNGSSADVRVFSGQASGTGSSGNVLLGVGTGGATVGSLSLNTTSPSFGGGQRVVFCNNANAAPTSNPTNGFLFWSDSGNMTIRTSGGAQLTLGPTTTLQVLNVGGDISYTGSGTFDLQTQNASNASSASVSLLTGNVVVGVQNPGDILLSPGSNASTGIKGNISLGSYSPNFGGGTGVIFIPFRTTAPTGFPSGGGVLYCGGGSGGDTAGLLYWRSLGGTRYLLSNTIG